MPSTDTVRALLDRDRPWCAYALGDLDPRRAAYCEWFVRGDSVALLYREFEQPILFAAGSPDVLQAVPDPDACLLQLPDSFREVVAQRFSVQWIRPMLRMSLDTHDRAVPELGCVEALTVADEAELRALYADGGATHEEPDFFMRTQLLDDTFFGVRVDGRLVAAGGTHLYSAVESVGAIGNVYTHRAWRGRGYGLAVTSAVVRSLLERGTRTIALNVKTDNHAAIRVYERIGFTIHTGFFDGRATRR
jgi:ribosomal protein S18 acetylase RimI-like enzyme